MTRHETLALSTAARRQIKELLVALAQSETDESWPSETPSVFFMREGRTVALSGDDADRYSKSVELLIPPPNSKRPSPLSQLAAQRLLHDAILAVIDGSSSQTKDSVESRVRRVMQQLTERMAEPPRLFDVHLPIAGVRLKTSRLLRVGPVTVLRVTPKVAKRWLGGHGRWTQDFLQDISAAGHPTVFGSTSVMAVDSKAARELGAYRIQLALDVVNLYAGKLGSVDGAVAYIPGVRGGFSLSSVTRPRHASPSDVGYVRSVVGPHSVALASLVRLRGYRRLSELIGTDRALNDVEERCLSALRWLGRGAATPWNEEALVAYVIALEALLLGPVRDQELKYRLRIRAAHLLTPDRSSRKRIFKRVGEIYDLRSAVVHQGSLSVTREMSLAARAYATIAILRIVSAAKFPHWKSHSDLDAWLERHIL